jgi:hypothetical protein
LLLVEEWETRQQFERNLDAEKLNAIVAAIELSNEPSVVRLIPLSARMAWRS